MITVSQSFKIFELLNKHFKNEQDAKVLVAEIESVIETRFQSEKDRLATKEDLLLLENNLLRLENKMELAFKDQLKWMIILMFGFASLIISVIKFL